MRTTTLPGTTVSTSALGLGTADLFRLPHRADRLWMLAAAHDAGIAHFDTAPMYGLGAAEAELGRFARGRRDRLVIATKFGISPTLAARTLSLVQGPLRRILSSSATVQRQARTRAAGPRSGPAGALLYSATGYDARNASRSLHSSLRALRTDWVDLFLLHEPRPGDARTSDICAFLEQARTAGLVRAWGVAGECDDACAAATRLSPRAVLQVRDDIFSRLMHPAPHRTPRIQFGVLGQALPQIAALLEPGRARGAEVPVDRGELASLLLREAMRSNPDGVLLMGTTDEHHLRAAVEAANTDPTAPDQAVDVLARRLAAACSALTAPRHGG